MDIYFGATSMPENLRQMFYVTTRMTEAGWQLPKVVTLANLRAALKTCCFLPRNDSVYGIG